MLMMMLMMNFPPKNIAFLRWWIHCSRNANKMNDEWRCKREKTAGADRRKRPCLSWLPKLQHISMFLWTDGMEKRKGKSRRRSHTSMTSAYDTTRRKQHNREASRVIHPNGFSYGKWWMPNDIVINSMLYYSTTVSASPVHSFGTTTRETMWLQIPSSHQYMHTHSHTRRREWKAILCIIGRII